MAGHKKPKDIKLLKVTLRPPIDKGEGGLWDAVHAIPKKPKKKERVMDKYGVVTDDEKTKTASTTKHCPECGTDLSKEETPNYCPNCGTRPFEKRREEKR